MGLGWRRAIRYRNSRTKCALGVLRTTLARVKQCRNRSPIFIWCRQTSSYCSIKVSDALYSHSQMLKPRYTCGGFDMSSSKKESNTAFLRAIRAKTPHLSDSIPKFHEIIDQEVSAALAQCSNTNNEGFKSISLTGLIGSIQDRFNILFYLGDEFCQGFEQIFVRHSWPEIANNRDFMKWFKKYVPQAHVLCEALCLVPRPLRSYANTFFLQSISLVLIFIQLSSVPTERSGYSSEESLRLYCQWG